MRVQRVFIFTLSVSVIILSVINCGYDGPVAMYNQKHITGNPPSITQILPDSAVTGVNFINIEGENFSENLDSNEVYIDGNKAEIVEHSSTSLTIRRPNCAGDSTKVVVSVFGAVDIASYTPYPIAEVYSAYGKFLSGATIGAMVVDDDENVYVIENNLTHYIYKVTPDGEKTVIGQETINVYDAAFSPDGNLVTFIRNKDIHILDIVNGVDTVAVWTQARDRVTHGDFDSNGNLFTSGAKSSDLMVVDQTLSCRDLDLYASDEILWIDVVGDYIYLLVELSAPDAANPELAIWRHEILDADGNLGSRQLVLDWSTTGEFAESTPKTFTVAGNNSIFIGTDYEQPILFLNSDWQSAGIVYKDILPTSAEKLGFGSGNYLYMVLNGETWDLLRIDVGDPDDRDFEG